MELPIALAVAEPLADRPQLVWAAFVDAAAALRGRLWLPPPYRFVVGPHTAADRVLAVRLREAGREVDELPVAGWSGPAVRRPAVMPGRMTRESPEGERHRIIGARLARFDAHARLGWAGAIVVTDRGVPDDPAVSLAVAAYRHHRRLELRAVGPGGADPAWTAHTTLDGLPAARSG